MNADAPFTALDRHFASLIMRLAEKPSPELELAAQLVSQARGEGHVCTRIADHAGQPMPGSEAKAPAAAKWIKSLRASKVVGQPGEFAPLILDESGRLYLRRYWEYETRLAGMIRERVSAPRPKFDPEQLRLGLAQLFPEPGVGTNWQKVAAFTALTTTFCVITGGPGTGKTHTVATILALLLDQDPGTRVALAAPTGKAAARLKESIQAARSGLPCEFGVRERFPQETTTIHRLLGTLHDSPYFRHDAGHPLAVDALVVDEASMVDLALMTKLFAAVPPQARIILLGDKDQLASVEAGATLGDICNTGTPLGSTRDFADLYQVVTHEELPEAREVGSPMQNAIVELRENHRFGPDSGIYRVSQAVNAGDIDATLAMIQNGNGPGVVSRTLPVVSRLARDLREAVVKGFRPYLEEEDPGKALAAAGAFRVLSALRRGPFGVDGLNLMIERILQEAGLIPDTRPWYRGRPVMITRNDYDLRLFNGEIGLILPDPEEGGALRAFFPPEEGRLRRFLPARLPAHETAFAMTIHKSQGSEFRHILMVLPESDSPVLTRELVYTGLTRAREQAEVWMNPEVLRLAVGRRVTRSSGLREALWSAGRSRDPQTGAGPVQ